MERVFLGFYCLYLLHIVLSKTHLQKKKYIIKYDKGVQTDHNSNYVCREKS